MKIKNGKSPHSIGPAFQPEACHCRPGQPASPPHTSRRFAHGHHAVATHAVARPAWLRRWPRCRVPGGDSMGERRRLRCAEQGGAAGFSPEMASGGGAEKTPWRDGVPRRWLSSDGRGGRR
jgi:hypothetical protein